MILAHRNAEEGYISVARSLAEANDGIEEREEREKRQKLIQLSLSPRDELGI